MLNLQNTEDQGFYIPADKQMLSHFMLVLPASQHSIFGNCYLWVLCVYLIIWIPIALFYFILSKWMEGDRMKEGANTSDNAIQCAEGWSAQPPQTSNGCEFSCRGIEPTGEDGWHCDISSKARAVHGGTAVPVKYGLRMSRDPNAAFSLTSSQRWRWLSFHCLLKIILRKLTWYH